MSIDTTSPRTRRAILLGVLGGVAASVAATVSRASPVAAHDPDDVRLGADNTATALTSITNLSTDALFARTDYGVSIYGASDHGTGVRGTTDGTGGNGVLGTASGAGIGVFGSSNQGTGAGGLSQSGTGVFGHSNDSFGVDGESETSYGVHGTSHSATGVVGQSSLGRGGSFTGKKAQIRLEPSTAVTHPTSGQRGDLFVDKSGRLWFCKGGTTWVKLA